jgi:hypothetical protein
MHSTLEAVRAEALFASTVQSSDLPNPTTFGTRSPKRCGACGSAGVPYTWPASSATIRTPRLSA